MLDDSSLPADTAALLRELSERTDLEGFLLIGETALALRHGHRISEDIDLAWPDGRLPRGRIHAIMRHLSRAHVVQDAMPLVQRQEFEDGGLELDDYHQDWRVGTVKVTFFAPDESEAGLLGRGRPDLLGRLPVADDDLLFSLKSRVTLKRTVSRDLFDLWYMVDRLGRRFGDILDEMAAASPHVGPEGLLSRLTPSRLPSTDPGFDTSLEGAPRDPAELLALMAELVKDHQRDVARRIALEAMRGPGL